MRCDADVRIPLMHSVFQENAAGPNPTLVATLVAAATGGLICVQRQGYSVGRAKKPASWCCYCCCWCCRWFLLLLVFIVGLKGQQGEASEGRKQV